MEEATVGAVGTEQSGFHAGLCAVRDFHGGGASAQLCFDPAGMNGVHLEGRVLKLIGQVDGEGVERGLRCVVRKVLESGDGTLWIGVQSERAEDAGEIDNAAGVALLEKRQQLLRNEDDGEDIGLEDAPQLLLSGAC